MMDWDIDETPLPERHGERIIELFDVAYKMAELLHNARVNDREFDFVMKQFDVVRRVGLPAKEGRA